MIIAEFQWHSNRNNTSYIMVTSSQRVHLSCRCGSSSELTLNSMWMGAEGPTWRVCAGHVCSPW